MCTWEDAKKEGRGGREKNRPEKKKRKWPEKAQGNEKCTEKYNKINNNVTEHMCPQDVKLIMYLPHFRVSNECCNVFVIDLHFYN